MHNVTMKVSHNSQGCTVKMKDKATGSISSFFSENISSGVNLAMSWYDVDIAFNAEDSLKTMKKKLKKVTNVFGEECFIELSDTKQQ